MIQKKIVMLVFLILLFSNCHKTEDKQDNNLLLLQALAIQDPGIAGLLAPYGSYALYGWFQVEPELILKVSYLLFKQPVLPKKFLLYVHHVERCCTLVNGTKVILKLGRVFNILLK